MLGPSGFFQTIGDADSPVPSKDLEIIHDSEAGFNILYRGSKNGRFFVYKALKPEYRGNPLYEELLKKDFNIGFSLTHTGICQYYGMVNLPETGNCIVMEWIDGCSLEQLVSNGSIDHSLALKIICELCDALDYMHRKQIIHRDLKPENILVTHNGRNVKIIDFGLSDADSYNTFKTPAGTRIYASPELLAGEHIDGRSDIWSLGMIISELSHRYRHVVARCIRRDRDSRYASAAEVRKAILTEGRRKAMMAAVCTVVVAMAVFGVWWCADKVAFPERASISAESPVPSPDFADSLQSDVPVPVSRLDAGSAEPEAEAVFPEAEVKAAPAAEAEGVNPRKESATVRKEPVQKEEKATEPIDSTALEDLFNEASDMLL